MANVDLRNASVLVAGASGGLGSALAQELAGRGARLSLLARDQSRLDELPAPGLRIDADIRNGDDCQRAVQQVIEKYGALDGLINAAGVVAFGSLAETDDETLDTLFGTNVVGPLRLIRAALPKMDAGFLVNITAVVVERPMAGLVAYCASKGALATATEALRREVRAQRKQLAVIDARPPHTETGLADRPITGQAPRLPKGLSPDRVAQRIVAAIEAGETEVPSQAFFASAKSAGGE